MLTTITRRGTARRARPLRPQSTAEARWYTVLLRAFNIRLLTLTSGTDFSLCKPNRQESRHDYRNHK